MIVSHLALIGASGTNKVMAGELVRLSKRAFEAAQLDEPIKEGLGALLYPFDPTLAALAFTWHRTSSRVLWDLYRSDAVRLEPLYEELLADVTGDTRPWLADLPDDGATFSITPGATQEFAAGGRQLVGVLKNALVEGAARQGKRLTVDPEHPHLNFSLRVHDGFVTASLDLGGQGMHLRGYRTEGGGTAPLRETLAATLVMLARHDARNEALIDPMAGSGTLAIEAACMAQARPVWVPPRTAAAATMPLFAEELPAAPGPLFGDTQPVIFANEIDRQTFERSRLNVTRAGVAEFVEQKCGDFRHIDSERLKAQVRARGLSSDHGVILCNPPYGERLDPPALGGLYRDLGVWCRRFPGWRAAFIVANPDFEPAFGGVPRIKKPLSNGSLRAYFLMYDL